MGTTLAKIISVILHPLLMPSLGLLIIFNSGTYLSYLLYDSKKILFLVVILCTIIIPLSILPFFLYQKLIISVQMNGKRERYIPLITGFLFYTFCYILVRRFPIPPSYHAFFLGTTIAVLCCIVISVFWKISAHMVGIGGLTGLIVFLIWSLRIDLQFLLILAIVSAGLIGFARLQLKVHEPAQVYSGFVAGFFSVGLTMLLY
jgi:hypothetical protein